MSKQIIYFIRGFGSVLVLQPPRLPEFRPKLGSFETDYEAVADDWRKVGEDLRWAMGIGKEPRGPTAAAREE